MALTVPPDPETQAHLELVAAPDAPDLDLYDRIAAFLPEAQASLAALDSKRDEVIQETQTRIDLIISERHHKLGEIENKKKRLIGLVKLMGGDLAEPVRVRRRTRQGSQQRYRTTAMSPAKMVLVIDAILAWPDELFSVLALHEAQGFAWHSTMTRSIFEHLRAAEFIGQARKERKDEIGDRMHGRMLYRVLSREVGERLKAEAN